VVLFILVKQNGWIWTLGGLYQVGPGKPHSNQETPTPKKPQVTKQEQGRRRFCKISRGGKEKIGDICIAQPLKKKSTIFTRKAGRGINENGRRKKGAHVRGKGGKQRGGGRVGETPNAFPPGEGLGDGTAKPREDEGFL